ncbi:hypothetical protein FQR65_LT02961 [Abscondita terminalis]|nr:hypothetical protein FQR65_LT02961 [Abscondita terminalis]
MSGLGDEEPVRVLYLKGHTLDVSEFPTPTVRNICILAHVDHGKTCVADCLLTLNGLVNKRAVGKTKYLDSRRDEQNRQITMKCSAVSIGFHLDVPGEGESVPCLMNLVDTPGHIDFATEVIAATRICDGALLVVDIVEGVSPQTKLAIRYAFEEKLEMILIINKFDRLFVDLQMPINQMYLKFVSVIEECNNYIGMLERFDFSKTKSGEENLGTIYFDPVKGNVIFASAIHNWGFTLRQIANMYVNMLEGETEDSLTVNLWEPDLYISSVDNRIKPGAAGKRMNNVFTQLICSMLNYIYSHLYINENQLAVPVILCKLGLESKRLFLKYNSCKMKLNVIMEAWNSLARTIALRCYYNVPSPDNLSADKVNYLLNLDRYSFSPANQTLEDSVSSFRSCSPFGPPIAYVTKLFVNNKGDEPLLNELMDSELTLRLLNVSVDARETLIAKLKKMLFGNRRPQVMGLVRVYSGILKPGQELSVLNSEYNPIEYLLAEDLLMEQFKQLPSVTIEKLFILLGSECKITSFVEAGYICGATFRQTPPYGSFTLADNVYTAPIIKQYRQEPIVYNVITPLEPNRSQLLRAGLQLLQQFDSSLRTFINECGEYVLTTAGSMHLDKCLTDLRENIVDVDMIVSPPIYSLRETVEQSVMLPISKTIKISSDCKIYLELSVVSLPESVATILQTCHNYLCTIQEQEIASISDICLRALNRQIRRSTSKSFSADFCERVVSKLQSVITNVIRENDSTVWNSIDVMNIMRVGNSRDNINLIINDVTGYSCNLFYTQDEYDPRLLVYNYLVNAFNLACDAGPLCKEPVSNCAFILSELQITGPINLLISNDPLTASHITQQLKDLFYEVILKEDVAVMEPMLETSMHIAVNYFGEFSIFYCFYDCF